MKDTERERQRHKAEGEAGSIQGARRGTHPGFGVRSGISRITPWAEGGATGSHPGLKAALNRCATLAALICKF